LLGTVSEEARHDVAKRFAAQYKAQPEDDPPREIFFAEVEVAPTTEQLHELLHLDGLGGIVE
jgi:hypothetical protein